MTVLYVGIIGVPKWFCTPTGSSKIEMSSSMWLLQKQKVKQNKLYSGPYLPCVFRGYFIHSVLDKRMQQVAPQFHEFS